MKPSKKHCIFDLDGTLLDSMTTWPPAMIKIMDDAGLEYPDDVVNIMTPIGFNGCADYFISLGHPEKDPERLTDIMYDYLVDDYSNRVMIKPYVKEMLEKLRDDGIKIYALTASPHRTVDPCLAHNGIAHFFEEVMSTDDLMMKSPILRYTRRSLVVSVCVPMRLSFTTITMLRFVPPKASAFAL
jgi:beta-phosphoglucomutase-like phosphatase (HAD superfamily)